METIESAGAALLVASHTPGLDGHLDAQLEALDTGDGLEQLLGGLLAYWGRERRADVEAKLAKLNAAPAQRRSDADVLDGLEFDRLEPAPSTSRRAPTAVFSYPAQELSRDVVAVGNVILYGPGGELSLASIESIDVTAREVRIRWTPSRVADGLYPVALVGDDWVNPHPKPAVMSELAEDVLAGIEVNPVTQALLVSEPPRFKDGHGLINGVFSDDLDEVIAHAKSLDGSYLCVQGPPGAGKTFYGARLVYELVIAGLRVGITATSHAAIDNLLAAVTREFEVHAKSPSLRAVRRGKPGRVIQAHVSYETDNVVCCSSRFNVVAGTTWLFGSEAARAHPVDVLVIDEAGQMALADAVVASMAARNVVLLGDPRQLAQVTQAEHPGGSGCSVFAHALEYAEMIAPERGVFLSTTRRMAPVIGGYISDGFYDGRLGVHESCAVQSVEGESSNLAVRTVHHTAMRRRESPEEVKAVHQEVTDLLGRTWTHADGTTTTLGGEDVIVVAPYNDAVDALAECLGTDPVCAGIEVGTVDRFQGREAAVVIYAMTSSSLDGAVRGAEFLFSPNRFNVAISRARALAVVVVSDRLLADAASSPLGWPLIEFAARATRRA
jgi:uncharacterized protein